MFGENTKVTIGFVCPLAIWAVGYGTLQAKVNFLEERQERQAAFTQRLQDKDDEYRLRLMDKVTNIQERIGVIEGQLKNLRLK